MNNLCVPQRFHPRTWTLNIGTGKNVFHELWIKTVKVLKILVVTVRRREAFTCIRDSGLRFFLEIKYFKYFFRSISRIPAASRMELFATLVNGFQPSTKVTKNSILHVAGVLGKPLFFVIFILYLFYLCYLLLFYQIEV